MEVIQIISWKKYDFIKALIAGQKEENYRQGERSKAIQKKKKIQHHFMENDESTLTPELCV